MYLVAVGQDRRFDRSTVDIGFVEAADVHDAVLSVFRSKLGMSSADGDVVEEDVAARKSPGDCDGLSQQEAGSSVTPAFDDKQRRVFGQLEVSPS